VAVIATGDLVSHLEGHLGPIDGAWSQSASGEQLAFKVLRFMDVPMMGGVTYVTLGMSDVELSLPLGKGVRQELLFCCRSVHEARYVPGLLHLVGKVALRTGRALARGAVVGPAGPLFPESNLTALYSSIPAVFPESLGVWHGSSPATVFDWLIPITTAEVRLVHDQGWSKFEDLLENKDPDLFDLNRASVA
jgi:hypothetical protein